MDLEQMVKAAALLPDQHRKKLARSSDARQRSGSTIQDPGHWISYEELKLAPASGFRGE